MFCLRFCGWYSNEHFALPISSTKHTSRVRSLRLASRQNKADSKSNFFYCFFSLCFMLMIELESRRQQYLAFSITNF